MRQFPLLCADSLTIHKFQGQTCEFSIRIPTWSGMKMQEAYVAITRVRSLNQLFFDKPITEVLRINWTLPRALITEMERLDSMSRRILSDLGCFCL